MIISKRKIFTEYILICVGTLLMSIATKSVYDEMSLVTGGVTGIGIIVKYLTRGINSNLSEGIPLGITNFVINIPLFLLAIKVRGKNFIKRTLIATVLLSLFLGIVPRIDIVQEDYLVSTILGAVLMGIGVGLVFISNATTGGSDLLAMIIQYKYRHLSVAYIMAFIDGVIVIAGAMVFGLGKAVYAIIAIFIMSKISDRLIEGIKFAKMAFIVSEKNQEISQMIIGQVKRGVTKIDIVGMYTYSKKSMLMCVVSKKQIVKVKDIVSNIDSEAFVIVSDVRETLGKGFLNYRE